MVVACAHFEDRAHQQWRTQSSRRALRFVGVATCAASCALFAFAAGHAGPLEEGWLGPRHRCHGPAACRPPRPWRFAQRPLRALPANLENAVFGLSMQANEAIGVSLDAGTTLPLLPVLFVAGLLSSVNPCSAATLPAAVASVAALGQGRAGGVLGQAAAFAAGSGTVLAALGLAASVLGEQLLPAGGPLQWLFPCIAVLMGLGLLGLAPLGIFGLRTAPEMPTWVPGELQGFALGAASALGSSPCATPVLVTIVSYLATHPQGPGVSMALFLSYALGYNAPLALAAAFAGTLPLLQSGSSFGPLVAGAGILSVGTAQLVGLGEERVLGPAPPGVLGIVMAAVTLIGLAGRVVAQRGNAATTPDITPVLGETGVYRYRPLEGALTTSAGAFDDSSEDGRRAALAAVCFGSAAAGASNIMTSDQDSPPAIIRGMAERSRPLSQALRSGRPMVVDFSATWCADCLKLAPALRELEGQYSADVEFVTLDVSSGGPVPGLPPPPDPDTNWWTREFGVDGIPHIAFVDTNGRVLTALVGDVPPDILRADIEALRQGGKALPYVMYDAFKGGRTLLMPSPPQPLGPM